MSRSPLAYPLTRGIDGDSGGAADLQTDIMRFMAILSLCLVAIFALVQSLPIEAQPIPEPPPASTELAEPAVEATATEIIEKPVPAPQPAPTPPATPASPDSPSEAVVLTRPKWVTNFQPRAEESRQSTPVQASTPTPQAAAAPVDSKSTAVPAQEEVEGFTLRFESDLALTRLVANGKVGFYAIGDTSAQRMAVRESRISFWEASTPNAFHEMEATTVPQEVTDALRRSGTSSAGVAWGVTLPGRLSSQLNSLMQEHKGGALVIDASGNLKLESG
jgi:type IV secretory pathway VirB10-like protein